MEGSLDGHPAGSSNSSSGSSIVQLIAKPDDILTYCRVHMSRQRILQGIEANLTTKTPALGDLLFGESGRSEGIMKNNVRIYHRESPNFD